MKDELFQAARDGFVGGIYLFIALFLAMVTGPFRLLKRVGDEWLAGKPMHYTGTRTIPPN